MHEEEIEFHMSKKSILTCKNVYRYILTKKKIFFRNGNKFRFITLLCSKLFYVNGWYHKFLSMYFCSSVPGPKLLFSGGMKRDDNRKRKMREREKPWRIKDKQRPATWTQTECGSVSQQQSFFLILARAAFFDCSGKKSPEKTFEQRHKKLNWTRLQ